MTRADQTARSIAKAIAPHNGRKKWSLASILSAFAALFSLFRLRFERFRNDLFHTLRTEVWQIDEDSYESSFGDGDGLELLQGNMGYSGSTFFSTKDKRFLVKSVPRRFENTFFRHDLLLPYYDHMKSHAGSLLVRITDFLCWENISIGGILGLAPTHHIVMENLLLGQTEASQAGGEEWKTFDLKPHDYFFPERDIAGGYLSTEATKDRLVDIFDGKIVLTQAQADEFLGLLEQDTLVLQECNAVDYSLFLVRIPLSSPQNPFADGANHDNAPESPQKPPQDPFADDVNHDNAPIPPQEPPLAPPSPPTWRTGIRSADSKYVFRAVVLDFFWAKHKAQPKIFTFLIKCWNLVNRQGPMSITTTPEEYRTRFLKMCSHLVEVSE